MPGLGRVVDLEPLGEQILYLMGQAQEDIARRPGAGGGGGGEDVLELHIVERRDHRRRHDAHRNGGIFQRRDGFQPPLGRRRARFHAPRQRRIEGGHGNTHAGEPLGREGREDVDIAHHQGRFGHHRHRMVEFGQHLEDAPGDLEVAFDRLVGIGVGSKGDGTATVARIFQLLYKQGGGVALGEQAGFEIEPRRKPEPGMGGAGIAIDAAVLATAVGIDRTVEGDVGGGIARDHGLALVGGDRGAKRGKILKLGASVAPAIVDAVAFLGLEAT